MSVNDTSLGARLRRERKARGMITLAMAEALRASATERERRSLPKLEDLQRMIRNWENNKWGVSEKYKFLYCRALQMDEESLFNNASSEPQPGGDLEKALASEHHDATLGRGDDEEDVERRRLLQALTTLGVASASPVTEALQTIRGFVERNLDRGMAAQLDDWEAMVADHGYAYLATSPEWLVGELAADLVVVQSITPRICEGHPQYSQWCRVIAGLASLMAKTVSNLGQIREACRWWWTAQHAADASRDIDLSLWVNAERLTRSLYEQRPVSGLIRQAADATAQRPDRRPCAGLAEVRTLQAQLFAMTGQARDALAEVGRVEEVFAHLPSSVTDDISSVWTWGEDRVRYTSAWVHAYLGEREKLDAATGMALELYKGTDPRSETQIKLIQAFGHIRAGDITEGIKHATSVYGECPTENRTAIVARLAGQVWNAVPSERRDDPSVASYRDLLAVPSTRRSIT